MLLVDIRSAIIVTLVLPLAALFACINHPAIPAVFFRLSQ